MKGLTDERDGCVKAGSDVSYQRVLHSESQVLKLSFVEVWAGGGYVEDSCDACCCQRLSAGRVDGTAQEQEGKQLHRTILEMIKTAINQCV